MHMSWKMSFFGIHGWVASRKISEVAEVTFKWDAHHVFPILRRHEVLGSGVFDRHFFPVPILVF
jgi:hypothetical protein